MDAQTRQGLEQILEALVEAGEGEAFVTIARRIMAIEGCEVRISIEPPLDNREAMTFDEVSHPMRWRRA
jgi:hypothetical protein